MRVRFYLLYFSDHKCSHTFIGMPFSQEDIHYGARVDFTLKSISSPFRDAEPLGFLP